MKQTVKFEIPNPMWLTLNGRYHWADKAKRTKNLKALGKVRGHALQPVKRCKLLVEVGYSTNRRADPRNAEPTVKALEDGLVLAGVFPDDDSTHVVETTYRRDPDLCRKAHKSIKLTITPIDGDRDE